MSASTPSTPALMPSDLRAHGRSRRLWRSVIAGYVLRADAVETLGDACRIADQLDELRDIIAIDSAADGSPAAMPRPVSGRRGRRLGHGRAKAAAGERPQIHSGVRICSLRVLSLHGR